MAHLYRLIFFAALVLFYVSAPRAGTIDSVVATATSVPPSLKWRGDTQTQGSMYFATAMEACTWSVNIAYGWPVASASRVNDDQYNCIAQSPPAPYPGFLAGTVYRENTCVAVGGKPGDPCPVVQSCPAGYFGPLAGMCSREQCADGTWKQPGTCPAVNKCMEFMQLKTEAGNYTGKGSTGSYRLCDTVGMSSSGDPSLPGCVVFIDANFAWGSAPNQNWMGTGKFTGEKCAPDPLAPPSGTGSTSPPQSPTNGENTTCPVGKVPGTVNGTRICVDPGVADPTTKKTTSTTSTPNPDGTTTQRDTVTVTECGPAGCNNTTTTTTTVIPSGGGPGTSTSQTTTGGCTRGSPGCSTDGGSDDEPSRFGGSCATAFSCDGDAIMCAVALEQHQRDCALFVDASPESMLYTSEKGKTGTQYGSETVTVGTGSFSQSNAIGGSAQCIADKTVTVWNQQVILPFSQVCASLQYLGTVLVFVSFLLAYRIVSRG